MLITQIIKKKRDGLELSKDELEFLVNGYIKDEVPDYQMSAFLMAVYFRGMTKEELTNFTMLMAKSGELVDLNKINGIKVDKHSSGGIADTTTLVLIPLAASVGVKIAKMSGRGLSHTGGTIDKLESIPGFKTELDKDEFIEAVNKVGAAIIGQSKDLVPADKKIYALRDVTATVESIPLIASSIMSKKIAAGADKIILDVKFGKGAFMKSYEEAKELAQTMVEIGTMANKETVAYVTDMNQPLGMKIGNSLEVIEAIEALKGNAHSDLIDLCIEFASEMMKLAGIESNEQKAREKLRQSIKEGYALEKFKQIIKNQGGNPNVVDDYSLLPQSKFSFELNCDEDSYIKDIDAFKLGIAALKLGAGRQKKDDIIDLSVGIEIFGKIGDKIEKGRPFAKIYANNDQKLKEAVEDVKKAFEFSKTPVEKKKVIFAKITKDYIDERM